MNNPQIVDLLVDNFGTLINALTVCLYVSGLVYLVVDCYNELTNAKMMYKNMPTSICCYKCVKTNALFGIIPVNYPNNMAYNKHCTPTYDGGVRSFIYV